LDRRVDTSSGSGGAAPTVVTSRLDDEDDDLTAAGDQPTEIVATGENGKDRSAGDAADPVPAMPADSIRHNRSAGPISFSRPASASAPAETEELERADQDALTPEPELPPSELASSELTPSEPAAAVTGTGWPSDGGRFGAGASTGPSADNKDTSAEPEAPGVSAAAFAWDPPEAAATSPSSPARNFLRSSAARALSGARKPATTLGSAPAAQSTSSATQPKGLKRQARQAHLTVARVEPWSVMKFSFVVSLVSFVILFVAVSILYGTLSALGVFNSLQHVVQSVTSSQGSTGVNAGRWFTASRVLGYTALLGSINIVLITAMSTIGAVIYNLTSRLIGGVEVTLRESE
jgi:Transmembrane domain of unknown function (DUF3566)